MEAVSSSMNKPKATRQQSEINSVPLLDVARSNEPLREEFLQALANVLDSGRFLYGPDVQKLEQSVAEYTGAEHAIGCASGSDALLLALMALEIGPGDFETVCGAGEDPKPFPGPFPGRGDQNAGALVPATAYSTP